VEKECSRQQQSLDVIPVTLLHHKGHFLHSVGGDRLSDPQDIKVRFCR
jgi:hypothetical protein